ncbi:hypothetical protein AB0H00_23520 [Nocardia sp. NPDC023852]|uniref:hypothetical protein n=1 Tax=Nocardia sp. NPDC023852 TaxID=3154697 RepID=UPI0033C61D8C
MSGLDDIRDLLGVQPYRSTPTDWEAASQALGASIPGDFHAGTATSFLLRLLRGQEPSKYLGYLQNAEQHSFTPAR